MEAAVNHPTGRRFPLLWRLYMSFEVRDTARACIPEAMLTSIFESSSTFPPSPPHRIAQVQGVMLGTICAVHLVIIP